MIGLLAFGLSLIPRAAQSNVIEHIEPTASEVSIQMLARVPHLTAKEADALDYLADDLARSIEGYGKIDVMTVTNGDPVRVVVGPDYVRVSFHVLPNNWRAGLGLMEAIARHSSLQPSDHPLGVSMSAWTCALRPFVPSHPPRVDDTKELYERLFRPENLTIGVGGPIMPGKAQADWANRMSEWQVPRLLPAAKNEPDPKWLTSNIGGLSTLELAGPVFPAHDPTLATKVLSLFALGSGKGASLFRIARQKLVYSYRQEALLYPVTDGWQSRLILVMKPVGDLPAKAETLRGALADDINAWSDKDLERALGMADAVLARGVEFSPFAFGPFGSMESSLEGRTFLDTYWQLKTGQPWDANNLLVQMRQVSLADLKAASLAVVQGAKVRILPG